tara:strand:- start:601 stop:1503 length:903 start_codon:yes stop_codon:yes gene_type:complete
MEHLLIAGGTGFIGYHLAKKFINKGWKVTSISLKKPDKKRFISGVKYILLDLTKKSNLDKKLSDNYTYIVNLSGHTSNLYAFKFKKKIFKSHYDGAKNLIDYFKGKNIKKFIQIGSSAEYGKANSPLKESIICRPNNIYGQAKLKATKYILNASKKKQVPAIVLRFFQVYGPKQGKNRAVMQILKFCLNKKIFPASDGKQIRDFCFIKDAIEAINLSMKSNISGKLINIGFGKGISMKKLIITIRKISGGGTPRFGLYKSRNHENPNLVPSISRARKILKWNPKVKIEKGIKITKNYFNE